jgi:molybdopterin-containing oxidoreductase family membrane subunit
VATDFAAGVVPGWHSTIFPPFFVVGAIFSGFAMVLTMMIIVRKVYKYEEYVTQRHLDAIARVLTFVSLIMGVAYISEIFVAWYSDSPYEMFVFFKNRTVGEYAFEYWAMITFNALVPQLFWFKKVRKNITMVFIISILINIGMWYERFVIVVTSLSKTWLPSTWHGYHPTFTEIGIYVGTIGFFILGILLFLRFLPMMAISELKGVLKETSIVTENTENHE